MKKVLVTGANGQLAKCINAATSNYPTLEFIFASRDQLNIEVEDEVSAFFEQNEFEICINTAAYTDVELAESEREQAIKTNVTGPENLAKHCSSKGIVLIHISTDYVFDGDKTSPYTEKDATNPINVYGESKLLGEAAIKQHLQRYYILRSSWLYSEYGHNFYNSVKKWVGEGKDLSITTEQTGVPTNAHDLAHAILEIASADQQEYGIYHFSNEGAATWYDFAEEIIINLDQLGHTNLAKTDYYRTFAKRPKYSVLDTEKFRKTFKIETIDWRKSLRSMIQH